jgi:hypothetical protein
MVNQATKELLKFNAEGVDPLEMYMDAMKACVTAVDEAYEKYGEPMYCGFASVTIRPARGRFVKFIQKLGLGHRGVYGGYSLTYHDIMKEHKLAYTQSMDLKEIGCHAFAKTLGKYGIEAVMESRPD